MGVADGGTPSRQTDETVLVAEDNDTFREMVSIWLDRRWTVREAATGTETLEKVDESVDVLVLDRRMPELDGPEVFDRLDETSFEGEVVVVSAFEPDDRLHEADVASYLTKPVDRDELLEHLEVHL